MSRRMKVLAALNVLGWVVAVPLLLMAVVDPFVDFGDMPNRLIGDRRGDVRLRTPEAPVQHAGKPKTSVKSGLQSSDESPLLAAREALRQFQANAGTVTGGAAGGAATGGAGGAGGSGGGRGGGGREVDTRTPHGARPPNRPTPSRARPPRPRGRRPPPPPAPP